MNFIKRPSDSRRTHQVWRKMAHTWLVFAVLMTGLSFLVSCAPPGSTGAPPASSGGKSAANKYAHLDPDEKVAMSDLLADEAEELLGFSTLNQAWGKFSESLEANPGNDRARLWKELLRPLFEMKGILARVRPLYLKHGEAGRYESLVRAVLRDSAPEYHRFMTEGPADIDTDAKFRAWIDRSIVTLDEVRNYINANKARTYTLRAPVHFVSGKAVKPEDAGRCTALKIMASTFSGCAESGMLKFKVNRADLELIQLGLSLQIVNFSVFYAFNVNPLAVFEGGGGMTRKEFLEKIMKGYDGSLIEENRLSLTSSFAPDWLAAQTYFVQSQDELCKNGFWSDDNRKGYLISSGICLKADRSDRQTNAELRVLEMLVLGQPVEIGQRHLERPVSIYPLKFLNSPPKNISLFMPTSYDPRGEVQSFNDSVFSPYFAEGTMSEIARAMAIERAQDDEDSRRAREQAEPSRGPSAAGEITGFRFMSCEASVCIEVEARKAWLSQTNGAFVASDGLLKIIKNGKVTREIRGTEIVSQPEIDMVTVESGATVAMVNLKTASVEVYGGAR